jgi:phage-related protein
VAERLAGFPYNSGSTTGPPSQAAADPVKQMVRVKDGPEQRKPAGLNEG